MRGIGRPRDGCFELARGLGDLLRGRLVPRDDLAVVLLRARQAGVQLGHLFLDLLREALRLAEVVLRRLGNPLEARRRDRDLLGGGRDRDRQRLEGALAVVQGLVLAVRVVGHEGDGDEHGREGHAARRSR